MRVFIWAALAVLIDQLTKNFFISQAKSIFWHGIELGFFANRGGAFSSSISNTTSALIAIVFLILLVFGINKSNSNQITLGSAIIVGGGLSNLIDRFFRGYVIDIIGFGSIEMNAADLFIMIGAAIISGSFMSISNKKSVVYTQKSSKTKESVVDQ